MPDGFGICACLADDLVGTLLGRLDQGILCDEVLGLLFGE
jgi:hypothetical protein